MSENLQTLTYFFRAAQDFAKSVREDPVVNTVVEEMYVCGSVGRFSNTPRDIDVLVFGMRIGGEHRKRLFQLRIKEDERLRQELTRVFPGFKSTSQEYIDLEVNNLHKRKYIEQNDPTSMIRL